MSDGGLTPDQADAIYTVLVNHAGAPASSDSRHSFIYHQTKGYCDEYRFSGNLGFGGKFWRNVTSRPGGTFGESWYITAYQEDTTPERQAMLDVTNELLEVLRQEIEDDE
jgi:hypothetical protein